MDQRTRVLYQALADFSALTREARDAKRAIRELKAEEAALNASSTRGATRTGQARDAAARRQAESARNAAQAAKRMTDRQAALNAATRLGTDAIQRQNRALATNAQRLLAAAAAANAYAQSQRGLGRNANRASGEEQAGTPRRSRSREVTFAPARPTLAASAAAQQYAENARRAQQATTRWGRNLQWLQGQFQRLTPAMQRSNAQANVLQRNFQRFANWRPRLTPPFVALIPIIAAVVAAINPLVALLGAVGTAAFGLTANIASLSGAFLALPGILSAVVGGIASVIASMGGVGNVFKTYSAMQKATTKGGRAAGAAGETQAERADRLARAEWNLAKAQRNVQKAQQNLNKARQQALEDLIDLRMEVERASLNEDRALANLAQARDNYNNVMADPGSQAGDKADAAVAIREAEADLADVRKRNAEAQQELIDAERKGIENSDRVIDAREDLQDAIYSERDAQKALRDEYKGGAQAASAVETATNEYEAALAKLSPSARAVVLALIALQDEWGAMRSDLQENFFSQFVGDMDKLPQIIRNIGNFLRPAARAMGQFVSALITLLASPEWSRDLATIGEENGKVIDNLGRGFLSLITFFKDLIIAAAPFTDWLTGAFADGLDNLSQLLDTDPEKRGLAAWLETVRGRLEKWWAIVKNVGATLFNYGSAASGFGDWLSDGFLQTTEGWKTASERAKEDGSPYKQFLEDIQPLLSNVNGLLGDFFGWMSREIMSTDNIEDANDLITLFRDELGPALSGFIDALSETDIDEAFVRAVSAIITSITELIEAGGGAGFEAFFDVIVGFFEALADILGEMDQGSVSLLLSVLGGLAALSFIGKFTGLTSAVGWLLRLDKAKFSALLGKGGLFAGLTLLAGGAIGGFDEEGVSGQDPAMAAGGGALIGSRFGPLGALIGTLTGLVTSMTTDLTDDKRGSWDIGLDQIFKPGDYSGAGIGSVKKWMDDVSREIEESGWWDGVQDRWNSLWNGEAWSGFQTEFRAGWDSFWGGIGTGWNDFWGGVAADWDTFWGETIPTGWNNFTGWLTDSWNNFWLGVSTWFDTTFVQPIQKKWNEIAQWFDYYLVTPIKRKWAEFQGVLQVGWSWINTYVFEPFKRGIDGVASWFEQGVNGLQTTWNRIQDIFKNPVKFVVNTVYNDGIRSFWNSVNDNLKLNMALPRIGLGFKEGGVLPGYSPGVDNHHFVDQNGNRLDLGGGEGILIPQATRQLGGKRGIDQINRDAKAGRQAFATGGMFGAGASAGRAGVNNNATRKNARRDDTESNSPLDWLGQLLTNPLKTVTDGLNNLVSPLLSQIGGGNFGAMLAQMPGKIISSLAGTADKAAPRGNTSAANGMAGGKTLARVLSVLPSNLRITSTYRTPAQDRAVGGTGHTRHTRRDDPAVDIAGSLPAMNAFARTLADMGGWYQVLYNNIRYPGVTWWPGHADHVHAAMKTGGVVPNLYDRGGWLKHGQIGVNQSGKPEAVLTNDESRGLKSLINGVGLSRGTAALGLANSVGSLQGAAQQIIDNSINVEKVEIHNPVPEVLSESLPKAIRRVGYMQNARSA
jgi:hypothetical protein